MVQRILCSLPTRPTGQNPGMGRKMWGYLCALYIRNPRVWGLLSRLWTQTKRRTTISRSAINSVRCMHSPLLSYSVYLVCWWGGRIGYARKHNYAIKLDLEMPRDLVPMAVWHKLNMIEYLIRTEEYDWIWWIDYDTVITNTDIKLEDIIKDVLKGAKNPDDIDLILTADWYCPSRSIRRGYTDTIPTTAGR